jgi:hypothetical protein
LKAASAGMVGEPFAIRPETLNIAYSDKQSDRAIHCVHKSRKRAWRIAFFSDPDGVPVEIVERCVGSCSIWYE